MPRPTISLQAAIGPGTPATTALVLDDPVAGLLDIGTLADVAIIGLGTWVELAEYTRDVTIARGRERQLDQVKAGMFTASLDNSDRRFDPAWDEGPYAVNGESQLRSNRVVRFQADYLGVTYDLFYGFIDLWPMVPTYPEGGRSLLQATDAFKILTKIALPAQSEVGAGDLTGTRLNRILDAIGWPEEARDIDTGNATHQPTTLAGPASNLMRLANDSERGDLYVAGDGDVTFRERIARFTEPRSHTSLWTFGDAEGELAYVGIALANDDQLVRNDISVARVGGATVTTANEYGTSPATRSSYTRTDLTLADDAQVVDFADVMLFTFGDPPHPRVDAITVQPDGDDSLWPVVLGARFGDRITVRYRHGHDNELVEGDYFIEGITHTIPAIGDGNWTTRFALADASKFGDLFTLDLSSLDGVHVLAPYWAAAAIQTPLPGGETRLIDENFDSGLDGEAATDDSTTADSASGSGTLTHSADWAIEGGGSLHIDGIDVHLLRWENTTHTRSLAMWYARHGTTPTTDAWFANQYAADGTTIAWRVGINTAGQYMIQAGTSGPVGVAAFVAESGKQYRFDVVADAATGARLGIYAEDVIEETEPSAASSLLTVALTDTSYSDTEFGLANAIVGGGTTVAPNLTNEGFNGTNGTQVTDSNTSADRVFPVGGTATLTFSSTYAAEGTTSMRINGEAYTQLEFDNPSMTTYAFRCYVHYVAASASSTARFLQVKNGGNTAIAFQVGVTNAGRLTARDGTTLVANTDTTAFTSGNNYVIAGIAVGGGNLNLYIWRDGIDDPDNLGAAWQTVTVTGLTATNFSQEHIGQINAVTGANDYYIDRWQSSNTAIPSPIGAGSGTGLEMFIDRIQFDSATMPTPADVVIDSLVDANLEPSVGCWWGATTGNATGQSSSSESGMTIWTGFAGRRPDIVHIYKTNAWNGSPTTSELNMAEPPGQDRAILFYTWKPDTSKTMLQIANGEADPRIIVAANGLKNHPYTILLGVQHEWDNDANRGTAGYTNANYVSAFRRVVQVMKANGADNVRFVWNVTGYSGFAGTAGASYEAMYPGDDVVDWIASDPYWDTTSSARDDFGELLNENFALAASWTGFYNWATTAHPTKPFMLAEWSPDFATLTDAQAKARLDSIGTQISSYPRVKAMVQWNSVVSGAIDGRIQGHPLSEASFAALSAMPWFNIGTENAP